MANGDNDRAMARVEPQTAGTMMRQDGSGGSAMTRLAETSASVLAEQARATIEARTMMALRRPRDMDNVRTALLKECARPGFALSARYEKPAGREKVRGYTIRFAEAAVRCMSNIDVQTTVVFDDETKRIVRVVVADLESNVPYTTELSIEKTVERSDGNGRVVLFQRRNSKGYLTFVVQATEDEMAQKQASLVSKAIRNSALRLLPGDILDDCLEAIYDTLEKSDKTDPDAARKKILDGFASIGVQPSEIKEYLGTDGSHLSPAEMKELRGIYAAVRDNETTWREVLAARRAERQPVTTEGAAAPSATDKAREAAAAAAAKTKVDKANRAPPQPEKPSPTPLRTDSATADPEPEWPKDRM
jgi:DNA-binding transcriptional MerR regulator